MGKIVVLAEKPSVGRSIAKVLGCSRQEEGSLSNDRYIVTWAVGHLVTLQEPDEMDPEKYKVWSMEALPILPQDIPLKVIRETSSQYKIVSKLINDKNTDSLVCATDAGREGELIFRYIYIQSKCKKPFNRLWISSLTDEAIRDGMNHLEPGSHYDALYRSARARSEADWLVGMNASRAFTLRYNTLLSVGRVQTPTLAFLVKRLNEIRNFVPVPYATVTADFGDYKGIFFSEQLDPDTHIPKTEQAEKVIELVKGRPGTVASVEVVKKKSQPPQLYDLTTLQRDANRQFGFTAERTLQLAQSLYEEHKALTYPRTDSRYLPPDMIPVVEQTMKMLPEEYQPMIGKALPASKALNNKRIVDASKVSDHHAILPTPKRADVGKMREDERMLYDLVVRRMLAAFYPVCEYESTKIITTVGRFNFRTTGTTILVAGWREIKPARGKTEDTEKEEETGEEEDQLLPVVKKGDIRTVKDATLKEKQTKPPSHYTDASLLLAMETAGKDSEDEEIVQQMKGHGIGTPATRASIIERIIKLKYAKRDGKLIVATDKGCALIQIAPDEITSAETTGRWEKALDKIAENAQDPEKFRESICRFAKWLVEYAQTNDKPFNESAFEDKSRKEVKVQKMDDFVCPVCGKGTVTETQFAFSCTEWKNCGFTVWKDTFFKKYNYTITAETIRGLLSEHKYSYADGVMYFDTKFGYPSLYFIKNNETVVSSIISVNSRTSNCPHCHKNSVKEYLWGYSCSQNCGFTLFKNAFAKHDGPPQIARFMYEDLITEGSTDGIILGTEEKRGVIVMDADNISWYRTDDIKNEEPAATESIVKSAPKKPARRKKRATRKS